MHKVYEDEGVFDIIYQIPQILFSTIITAIFTIIIKSLTLTEKDILAIKQENKKEKLASVFAKAIMCFLVKFIIFSFFNLIFLLFFWYYLGCFCAVYKNTQVHLISDTLLSFGLSLVYPFGLNLLPGFFRIPALKYKKKCLYQLSKIVQLI